MLAKNLQLDFDLNPLENSIADYKVSIESIIIYTDSLPVKCPYGVNITRPAIHSCIIVPIKPAFSQNYEEYNRKRIYAIKGARRFRHSG